MNGKFINLTTLLVLAGSVLLSACRPNAEVLAIDPTAAEEPATVIATSSPGVTVEPTKNDQVLIVFDDDGSPDGTSALLYFLANPRAYVISASISFGEAYPASYIQHIGRILDDFGIHDIPLGAGQASPLSGSNSFPDWIHEGADGFWGLPLPNAEKTYPVSGAANMLVSVIRRSAEPVIVFISGPCTNLAQALRIDPEIKSNIAGVYIMGGAIHVRGNIDDLVADTGNVTAEWNIYADPLAAKEVLESGLEIYLVPLDATNQVTINATNTQRWREGSKISNLSGEIYEMLMASTGKNEFMIWDLMTAAIAIDPALCAFEPLELEVVMESGVNTGQTVIVNDGDQTINICLHPDVSRIRNILDSVFSQN